MFFYKKKQKTKKSFFNNKNTWVTLLTLFWCLYHKLWTDFTYCSYVSIVDFWQVSAGWKWLTLDDDTSKKALLLHTAIICIAHLKFQKISSRWNHRSGFYPSTFLHPVNGSKNSILYWVFKLNLLKSLQLFSLFV